MNDGNLIRMAIPQLTEERRKELVKIVNKKAEEAKVAVRNIRRDGNVFMKKEEKKSEVSKDVIEETVERIQKLTDRKIEGLDKLTENKIKEVMSV
jgi:ribosome recycling factor